MNSLIGLISSMAESFKNDNPGFELFFDLVVYEIINTKHEYSESFKAGDKQIIIPNLSIKQIKYLESELSNKMYLRSVLEELMRAKKISNIPIFDYFEVGLSSKVSAFDVKFDKIVPIGHLAFLDGKLSNSYLRDHNLARIIDRVKDGLNYIGSNNVDIHVANSGGSFHIYTNNIISSNSKWASFLSSIGVIDLNQHSPDFDLAWILLSISRGYGCVRLSNITKGYSDIPRIISARENTKLQPFEYMKYMARDVVSS